MLGAPTSELVAGLEAVVVAALLLGLGYLIADLAVGTRELDEVDRWGLALAGICALALVLMLVHIATSGWLFSHPGVVRLVIGAAGGVLLVRRFRARRERANTHLWIAAGLVLASVAVWGSPVFRMMPLTATPDTQLHNGWIDQLMSGDTTFGAVLTGDVPNYYPWLFHSLGAVTTSITPGGTPFHSLGPVQLLQVAGAVLALFAVGRALTRRALTGFGAALFGALSGGFGFVLLNGFDVVVDPRAGDGNAALHYQGDLLFSRSYNVSFHNVAPPFPRDLAFALLISFVLLLAFRARTTSAWTEIAAGCCLGLVGLTGGETFLVGGALAVAVALFDSDKRFLSLVRILGPAICLYATWFVPLAINYAKLGGFVSLTHIIAVVLPATAILVSWGLVTPFALFGVIRYGHRMASDRHLKLILLFVLASGALLMISAIIPKFFGEAFDTLGRAHRYWPMFYLSVALIAALGFTELLTSLRNRSRALGIAAVATVTAIAWTSPVVASVALPNTIGRYPEIQAAMREEPSNLFFELRRLGPGCTVASPQDVAREVFAYTGFRLVLWTGSWFGENRARIRWADIYDRIGAEQQRIADNRALISGKAEDEAAILDRYGVDVVVLPAGVVGGPELAGKDRIPATSGDKSYTIVEIRACETG